MSGQRGEDAPGNNIEIERFGSNRHEQTLTQRSDGTRLTSAHLRVERPRSSVGKHAKQGTPLIAIGLAIAVSNRRLSRNCAAGLSPSLGAPSDGGQQFRLMASTRTD